MQRDDQSSRDGEGSGGVTMTTKLLFMGDPAAAEEFRGRVYASNDEQDEERRAFIDRLATSGVLECPAYDGWLAALEQRGWVRWESEQAPSGGWYRRWYLSQLGVAERALIGQR